jgi:hypothetical protein
VGPSQDRTSSRPRQARQRPARPRARRCLLKGCERRFQPVRPQARYCGKSCRNEAARWRAWKAQGQYRQSEGGRACRREQSRRRRERVAERKRRGETAGLPSGAAAWVIAQQEIFVRLRPARLLRDVRADTPLAGAAILLSALPACSRACVAARAALGNAMGSALAPPATATSSLSRTYCARSSLLRSFGVDPREEGGGRSGHVVRAGRFSSLVRSARLGERPDRTRPGGHR